MRAILGAVRFALPALIVLAGVVAIVVAKTDAATGAGIVLIGMGLLVLLLNVLFRFGEASNRDRDREEAARRFYDVHGRWPGRGELPEDRTG
jgi:uncharacterized membrane protein